MEIKVGEARKSSKLQFKTVGVAVAVSASEGVQEKMSA
jgi:hypothetical protein